MREAVGDLGFEPDLVEQGGDARRSGLPRQILIVVAHAVDDLLAHAHYRVERVHGALGDQRNAARRFNILIDTLYEARTLLIASAEAPPEEIYAAGDGAFEFRRTVSRLIEMQSEDYIANRPRR